jgi:hypothetical protein
MANITASGVFSSTAFGSNFDYTIALTNSASSTSAIGTFWYSWIPGQDRLATSPIAVTPPAGWSDQITHGGSGDGHGIQFTADSPTHDIQPGSSMNFSFESSDTPAGVNDNSVDYPGLPVSVAFVYPQGPFNDAGHEFVVTQAVSQPPPATPLVTVANVRAVQNKPHLVTQIDIEFSAAVNASGAESSSTYALIMAGKKGSFTARNARAIKIRTAIYDVALDEVVLTPKKPFALTARVRLTINGSSPGGLQDSLGRLIDGSDTGQAGTNAVIVLSRKGVSL